ncbi:MAG: zinc ribbon domain-containing protein, partial [Candidatus Promineifilaceae bacterium]
MRPSWNPKQNQGWYRCIARDRGYLSCPQPLIKNNLLDEQVVAELSRLTIPDGFRDRVEEAVQKNVENEDALARMEEIEEVVKRIDFSWEKGFLSPQEYIDKRNQIHREMEALRPVEYDDLIEAADLLENFSSYWEACGTVDDFEEARKQLLAKIIDRVFVYDDRVVAIALHGNYAVVLDNDGLAPSEIVEKIQSETKRGTSNSASTSDAQSGSDGVVPRQGCSCIIWVGSLSHPALGQYLLQKADKT